MVVAAARMLDEKVRARGYKTFLAGVGNSNLAAWLAGYQLKQAGVDVELMAETGMVGYLPRPAEPFVFSFRNFPSCKMLTDILHVMGIFMGGPPQRSAWARSRRGRSTSTATSTRRSSPASPTSPARAAPTTSPLPRGRWWCASSSRRSRFVDKVPYITAPGRTVRTVVSDRGVYEKAGEHGELQADRPLRRRAGSQTWCDAAREACGWDLAGRARRCSRFEAPTADELALIRLFDPRRYFLGQ